MDHQVRHRDSVQANLAHVTGYPCPLRRRAPAWPSNEAVFSRPQPTVKRSARAAVSALLGALALHSSGALADAPRPLAAGVTTDAALAGRPEVLRYLSLTGVPALEAAIPRGDIAQPFAYEPEWIAGPNGLPVLRIGASLANQRLVSWFLRFPPQDAVYARYCLLIEDDVADGMNERGVKLPGLAGGEVSWRMEHGPVDPSRRGLYAALDYRYAADTGAGYGAIDSMNVSFKAGLWYVIEQYVRLNTPGRADGEGKVWINGQLVWSSDRVKWREQAATRIDQLHVNVYHGGMGLPKGPMHYRLAGLAVATVPIGPPPELAREIAPEPMLPRTQRLTDLPGR